MRALILDDDDIVHEAFRWHMPAHYALEHAYTFAEFERVVTSAPLDVVFLDYDINVFKLSPAKNSEGGSYLQTGLDAATYLAREVPVSQRPGLVIVHALDWSGALHMMRVLKDNGVPVKRWEYDDDFHNFPLGGGELQ